LAPTPLGWYAGVYSEREPLILAIASETLPLDSPRLSPRHKHHLTTPHLGILNRSNVLALSGTLTALQSVDYTT
jgi:hypothetical protein